MASTLRQVRENGGKATGPLVLPHCDIAAFLYRYFFIDETGARQERWGLFATDFYFLGLGGLSGLNVTPSVRNSLEKYVGCPLCDTLEAWSITRPPSRVVFKVFVPLFFEGGDNFFKATGKFRVGREENIQIERNSVDEVDRQLLFDGPTIV
jgi:hypothetical protein